MLSLADGLFSVKSKVNSLSGFDIVLNGMKVPTLICHSGDYAACSLLIQC